MIMIPFNSAFWRRFYICTPVIKAPNGKKQFCRRRRRCVRMYKLSQRHIKRNYWSGRIARAIPPYSDYSDYKPLNYDCLCLVHKSTYDIRYGESPARFAAFSFLVVKAPITIDISLSIFLVCNNLINLSFYINVYVFFFIFL